MGRRANPNTGDPILDAELGALTPKQRRLAQEIASGQHESITQAALAAGYGTDVARNDAYQYAKLPALRAMVRASLEKHGYSIDTATRDIADIAFNGTKTLLDKNGIEHVVDDPTVRVKSHELAMKLIGAIDSRPDYATSSPTINITMYGLPSTTTPDTASQFIDVTPT